MTTYITCDVVDNQLWPMGREKNLERAIELAKLHKQVLCKLEVVEDYREAKND